MFHEALHLRRLRESCIRLRGLIGRLHINHLLKSSTYKLHVWFTKVIFFNQKQSIARAEYFVILPQKIIRSSHPEAFLRKAVLSIYSKFTREHPFRSAISIKLLCNFFEIAFRHGCSPVNVLHIFKTSFLKNTSEELL